MSKQDTDTVQKNGDGDCESQTLPETPKLQLQNLWLQQQLSKEQLNCLILRFLQTTEPRALQDQIDQLASRMEAIARQIFSDFQIDSNLHQINIEHGTVVKRPQ